MSQLIALIIAIALGAIVTAIGYVYLGDAFTNNSAKGTAQQLINTGSQLEMAFMAYKATNGTSPYHWDYSVVETTLITDKYLKDALISPTGENFQLVEHTAEDNKFLILTGTELSEGICDQVNEFKGGFTNWESTPPPYITLFSTYIRNSGGSTDRYGCFYNSYNSQYVFGYLIE